MFTFKLQASSYKLWNDWKVRERERKKNRKSFIGLNSCTYVGHCRWTWTKDQISVLPQPTSIWISIFEIFKLDLLNFYIWIRLYWILLRTCAVYIFNYYAVLKTHYGSLSNRSKQPNIFVSFDPFESGTVSVWNSLYLNKY